MKDKNEIPKFKSIQEEADFWDRNDVTDFMPKMKEVKTKYSPKILKEENIVIRVQPKMKKKLETMAENSGLTLSTMLRMWFVDRLNQNTHR
ncbi:MAG: CopG family antitoxin [Candidatus Shapirobacteria bacterium]